MTRSQQAVHNQKVILSLIALLRQYRYLPSYRVITARLNTLGMVTSRGNSWTPKRLFRMLQRTGYSGLWGLSLIAPSGFPVQASFSVAP